MLPPALGGLRVLRAAGPRPSSAREYRKDQCRAVPARRCNYTTSALSPSNREIKKSKRGEMRLWCGRYRDTYAAGKRAPRRCAPTNAAAGYSESEMRQAPKRRTSMWPPSTLTTVDGTPPGLMPSSTTISAERPTSASACGASVAAR